MKLGFLLILLLPLGAQAYVTWHIYQLVPGSVAVKALCAVLATLAFACFFSIFHAGGERLPLPVMSALYEVGNSWLIALLYLTLGFLLLDIGRLCHVVPRSFMVSSWPGTLTVLVGIVALLAWGNYTYRNKVRQPLELHNPSKTLQHSVKAVIMSDLHLGYHNRRSEFARWVDLVNAEHPDVVLIAGDIIDISVHPLLVEDVAAEFRRIEAPIYACLGNHEYFSGEPRARAFYESAGINLLRDTTAVVGDLCLIGRDDRSNPGRRSLTQIMQHADTTRYCILLDHQPHRLQEAEQCGIDFQFSGHTHHGQVWPGNLITEAMYEIAFGPGQRGNTHYYVSSGIGIWGGKFRIGTRSEYVVATIR